MPDYIIPATQQISRKREKSYQGKTKHMQKPCGNCPFLKEVGCVVSKHKAKTIIHHITHDGSFHCHKTVDYSGKKPKVTKDSKLCFGSVLFLEKVGRGGCRSNVLYRSAIAVGEFGISDLRIDDSVYDLVEEFIENSL